MPPRPSCLTIAYLPAKVEPGASPENVGEPAAEPGRGESAEPDLFGSGVPSPETPAALGAAAVPRRLAFQHAEGRLATGIGALDANRHGPGSPCHRERMRTALARAPNS